MTYHAKLIKGGKIVIPAALRHEFGFKDGDTLVFERDGEAIMLSSQAKQLKTLQAKVKKYLKKPVSVESYLQDKYAQADGE